VAPSAAKRSALARPMPLAAPVTMARFPSSRPMGASSSLGTRAEQRRFPSAPPVP
jgi:hypothetical protein